MDFHPYRRQARAIPTVARTPPKAIRDRAKAREAGAQLGLDIRLATPADVRWVMTWANEMHVPAPRSARTRWYIFLKDGERVGFEAVRHETMNGEPMYWIAAIFILPAYQRQHLAPQFLALSSQRWYQKGRIGCRIAVDNVRVIRLLTDGGMRKVRQTRQWVDLAYDLGAPWKPDR